jgi:hypothetical protein
MDFVTIAAAAVAVEGLINLVNSIKDVKETSWKYWGSLIVARCWALKGRYRMWARS